jgi:hypothetical protein
MGVGGTARVAVATAGEAVIVTSGGVAEGGAGV